jgi:transposase
VLTEVCPPTPADEALRDLVRARDDVREDVMGVRHRLGKLLLRRGLVTHHKGWTKAHRSWLRSLKFEQASDQAVLDDYLLALEQLEERLRGMDVRIEQAAQQEPYAQAVGRLRCFRGIDTLTALSLVAELHSFMRLLVEASWHYRHRPGHDPHGLPCDSERISWTLGAFQHVDFRGGFDSGCRQLLDLWEIPYGGR